ncbi:MAG: hypothetical protein KF851_16555 [Pirellulaceae bacterium]|nr:hypothetical protein [Pirellulaceae bacterium]
MNSELNSEDRPDNLSLFVRMAWPGAFAGYSIAVILTMVTIERLTICHKVCLFSTLLLFLVSVSCFIDSLLMASLEKSSKEIASTMASNLGSCVIFGLISMISLITTVSPPFAIFFFLFGCVFMWRSWKRFPEFSDRDRIFKTMFSGFISVHLVLGLAVIFVVYFLETFVL